LVEKEVTEHFLFSIDHLPPAQGADRSNRIRRGIEKEIHPRSFRSRG
jgi:hypothetical protein